MPKIADILESPGRKGRQHVEFVLGGGLQSVDRLYTNIPPRLDALIFGGGPLRMRRLKNKHSDSSGVRGAAWLWPVSTDNAAP